MKLDESPNRVRTARLPGFALTADRSRLSRKIGVPIQLSSADNSPSFSIFPQRPERVALESSERGQQSRGRAGEREGRHGHGVRQRIARLDVERRAGEDTAQGGGPGET